MPSSTWPIQNDIFVGSCLLFLCLGIYFYFTVLLLAYGGFLLFVFMSFVCVSLCFFFLKNLFFFLNLPICFLKRERERWHGVGGWRGGEDLGRVGGGETVIRHIV